MLAEDEREAFDIFVAARERYRTEIATSSAGADVADRGEVPGIVTGLMSDRGKPWRQDIAELWAEVNSFRTAELDHGTPSLEVAQLARFETWLLERYDAAMIAASSASSAAS